MGLTAPRRRLYSTDICVLPDSRPEITSFSRGLLALAGRCGSGVRRLALPPELPRYAADVTALRRRIFASKKRRYFAVMLVIYLKTLCAKLSPVKAVGEAHSIEDNGPFRGL